MQRELFRDVAVTLQYVGSDTVNLDRSFFNNTPVPGPGAVDPRRPSQRYRSRRIIANDLRADYDAVSVILRKRMSHGVQADMHYTWSRTRDKATHSNGGGQTMDNYDVEKDYGPANWDVPHRFVASYIFEPPFFKNSSNALLKYVVAGWQIAGHHDAPERHPRQRHLRGRPGQHRHRGPPASRPGRRRARPQLPAELGGGDGGRAAPAHQLLRPLGLRAARAVHVRQRAAQRPAGAGLQADGPRR